MQKNAIEKGSFLRLICVGIVLLGMGVQSSIAQKTTSNKDEVTLLNPFDLKTKTVDMKTVATVVVLRSAASLRSAVAPHTTVQSTSTGPQYIFRNSVVRCPVAPKVRSGSSPNE